MGFIPTCDATGYVLEVCGYTSIVPSLAECCAAAEEYACVCDPTKCPKSVPAQCDANKELTSICLNECCTTYACECKKCEEPVTCPAGYEVTETTDDCGCIKRTMCPP